MKRVCRQFSFAIFLLLSGCGNLQTLNDNMERSNEMIQGNTTAVTRSSAVISENTCAVNQSTQALTDTKEVIAGSTALLQMVMNQLNMHPVFFPVLLLILLLCLSLPSVILYFAYRTLAEKISELLSLNNKK